MGKWKVHYKMQHNTTQNPLDLNGNNSSINNNNNHGSNDNGNSSINFSNVNFLELCEVFNSNINKLNTLLASFNKDLDSMGCVDFIQEVDNASMLSAMQQNNSIHHQGAINLHSSHSLHSHLNPKITEISLADIIALGIYKNDKFDKLNIIIDESLLILADDFDASGQVFFKKLTNSYANGMYANDSYTSGMRANDMYANDSYANMNHNIHAIDMITTPPKLISVSYFIVEYESRALFKKSYYTALAELLENTQIVSRLISEPVILNELLRMKQQHIKQVMRELLGTCQGNTNLQNNVLCNIESELDNMLLKLVKCSNSVPVVQ